MHTYIRTYIHTYMLYTYNIYRSFDEINVGDLSLTDYIAVGGNSKSLITIICMYVYIYIHIYISRERERDAYNYMYNYT